MDGDRCERQGAIFVVFIVCAVALEGFVGGDGHDGVAWRRHLDRLDIRQCLCELQFLVAEGV